MNTPWARRAVHLILCTTGACTLALVHQTAGAAAPHDVTVAIRVSTAGLDLNRPADARRFYTRLDTAAWVACTRDDLVHLAPVRDPATCHEQALGNAIRSARKAALTQIYLESHTLIQAAAYGIEVPGRLAGLTPAP